jgi:hypothetical protein
METTAGSPATPKVAPRSGQLSVMTAVGVVVVGAALGLVRDVGRPAGQVRNAQCEWRVQGLVVTGVLTNETMSPHTFALTARLALGGDDVPDRGTEAVRVRALGTVPWRWVDVSDASRAGTPITACAAAAALPSSDD